MKQICLFRNEYFFLSNFYPCNITINDVTYPTVEHAFQAFKSHDINDKKMIAELPTPGEAKRIGRRIKLREDWEDVKDTIMLKLLRIKFNSNHELKEKLLSTNDAELIEGNNHGDKYWGMVNGVGKNKLGKLLMQVRKELKETDK